MKHSLCPDFQSIRKGAIILVENEGFDWKKNFNVQDLKQMYVELTSHYPFQFQSVKNFNTGIFFNLVISMARPFIPKHLYRTLQMGCQSELGRLDRLYLTPTVRVANERLLSSVSAALQKRYANEASFKL